MGVGRLRIEQVKELMFADDTVLTADKEITLYTSKIIKEN